MFDLEKYYWQCAHNDIVDSDGIFSYIRSFQNIILWGASYTGSAIGKKLLEENINFVYWDKRFEELDKVNNIVVEESFSRVYDTNKTVVIYCIPNHVLMPNLLLELKNNGYENIIRGDILYSGVLCKVTNQTGLSAKECWGSLKCRSVICERAKNILINANSEKKSGERIDFQYSVFILNSVCNLKCMHCVQFITNYPVNKRINVPFEEIKKDINVFLSTIDTVGTISAMGGETFMHPDLNKIVKEFSKYKNFGFLSLPTNGLFPIRPEQLEGIEDDRIIIAFGNYLFIANDRQKDIYKQNIDLVKSYGITLTEGIHQPTWVEPTKLKKLDVDEQYMIRKKQNCPMPPRNLQVRNGKIHVCDMSVAMHSIGSVDYPSDYLNLREECTIEERRSKLRELIVRPFYYTCGHCCNPENMVPAMIQGTRDVFS